MTIGQTGSDNGVTVAVSVPAEVGADTGYAWYVVGALALVNMASYVERQLPVLLFGQIKHDFHLSDTKVSLLAGFAFMLFYVGFGVIIGRLADRRRRKQIILAGIVFWSAATMLCGTARSFWQLFFARMSVGVGEATLAPSAISMISDLFVQGKLARALGIYTGAQYLGAGFALVVGGAAMQAAGRLSHAVPALGTLAQWQVCFLLVGSAGLLVIVPMLFVREPIRRGLLPGTNPAAAPVPFGEVVRFASTNRGTLAAHYLAFSISSALGFGTVAWVPTFFVRVHHWSIHDTGYVYGLMLACLGGAGVVAGARFAEWLGRLGYTDAYLRAPIYSMLLAAAPMIAAMLVPSAQVALGLLAVATFLSSFPVAPIIAALQVISPNQFRGQIVSFYLLVANILGVGLGPTLVALITDHVFGQELAVGRSIALLTAVVTPTVAVILAFGLKPYRRSVEDARQWLQVSAAATGGISVSHSCKVMP